MEEVGFSLKHVAGYSRTNFKQWDNMIRICGLRTVTPATVQIEGNRRGRETTQEVMKAVPRGNKEKFNRIRNNGDEEEDMDLSDII